MPSPDGCGDPRINGMQDRRWMKTSMPRRRCSSGAVLSPSHLHGIAKNDRDQAGEDPQEKRGGNGQRKPPIPMRLLRLAGCCGHIVTTSFTHFEVLGHFIPADRIECSIHPGEKVLVGIEMRRFAQHRRPKAERNAIETRLPFRRPMSGARGAVGSITSYTKDVHGL